MKKILFTLTFALAGGICAFSQSFIGKWKNIDDVTGKPKAVIEIYQKGNAYFGRIVALLIKPPSDLCTLCTDDRQNKPIMGLEILRNMKLDDGDLSDGMILDPEKGKEYRCAMSFVNADELKVRGYIGISLIGRNQYWTRVK